MTERICAAHETPLIELRCAYQHGTRWNNRTATREPNFECSEWYLVRDGKVVAECTPTHVRWLRGSKDDVMRQIAGRKEDGTGGRPWRIDGSLLDASERTVDKRRRELERERAKREGREPEEWAALRTRSKAYEKAPAFPTYSERYEARRQAKRDGVSAPEWAKCRKRGRKTDAQERRSA